MVGSVAVRKIGLTGGLNGVAWRDGCQIIKPNERRGVVRIITDVRAWCAQ